MGFDARTSGAKIELSVGYGGGSTGAKTRQGHPTKMDGQQLQAHTGCLVWLRLCNLAVENGLQAKLLDKFEEVIRENGMKEPTWEAMGKAIKAQVNPFKLV